LNEIVETLTPLRSFSLPDYYCDCRGEEIDGERPCAIVAVSSMVLYTDVVRLGGVFHICPRSELYISEKLFKTWSTYKGLIRVHGMCVHNAMLPGETVRILTCAWQFNTLARRPRTLGEGKDPLDFKMWKR